MSKQEIDMTGVCGIVYSPDDEDETGKGWYYQDWNTDETSDLYVSEFAAKSAAVDAGYRIMDVSG